MGEDCGGQKLQKMAAMQLIGCLLPKNSKEEEEDSWLMEAAF